MTDRYEITLELAYGPEPGDELTMAETCESAMIHLLRELKASSPAITACEDRQVTWVSLLVEADSPGRALDEGEVLIRSALHAVGTKTPGWEVRAGGFDSEWRGGDLAPA